MPSFEDFPPRFEIPSFGGLPEGILKQTNFMCAKIEGMRRKPSKKQ